MATKNLGKRSKRATARPSSKQSNGLDLKEYDGKIELMGAKGIRATSTIANVEQSNGVIQVVGGVLLPQFLKIHPYAYDDPRSVDSWIF
jgi:uncharacterized surface protein with fasciclin (FAS1) repeats